MEQLGFVIQSHRESIAIIPVLAALVAVTLAPWHSLGSLAPWFAVTMICWVASGYLNSVFLRRPRRPEEIVKWTLLTILTHLGPVLCFAAIPFLYWLPNEPELQMIIMIIVSAGQATSAGASAGYWPVFAVNFTCFTLAGILAPLLDPAWASPTMPVLTGVFGLYIFLMARSSNGTIRTVLLLKHAKDDLVERLDKANRAKSSFLASMSHELRTPLNAIMGFSDMMRHEVLGPIGNKSYKDYAEDIHHSGAHLLGLINDILDLSRIEAGRHSLVFEPVVVLELAQAMAKLLKVQSDGRGISLDVDVARSLVLSADARAMRQILLNLLSNAIKFTPSGGRIVVFGHVLSDGQAILGVSDTGCGIDEAEIDNVFEPFSQAHQDPLIAAQGTGLGLPIVRLLAEGHDARVTIESRIDHGTTVSIIFPAARVAVHPPSRSEAAECAAGVA